MSDSTQPKQSNVRVTSIGGWPARFFNRPFFRTGPLKPATDKIIAWYGIQVRKRTLLGQVVRKFRRFYLGSFHSEYIAQSVKENREGDCHRCGLCCELLYKCPFLGRDVDKLPYCRIYGDLRPANCHAYPFDALDSEIDSCGFTIKGVERKAPAHPKPKYLTDAESKSKPSNEKL